ncbi:GIY-YIG nuclease family protein [Streptomyces sp. NPDC005752]|uniref:GIY-YIG nuclease family protein n=1 Tax=Streptomyces sp. NPDC005752 TaxID=3157065 RepID=UPI0033D8AD56
MIDGTAGGLMTAEIMNWTGHLLKGKREKLGEIRTRPEARRTGVYILFGDDPKSPGDRLAYIGQSDDVANRLIQHDAKKDFWSEVVVITSKDTNLTSAHVRYLEARLIRLAKSIGRIPLDNGNEPTGGAELPEADASDMEYFIDQLRVVLPVLGIDMFRGRETRSAVAGVGPAPVPGAGGGVRTAASPVFGFRRKKLGVDARAQLIDGEFTVLEGSVVCPAMPERGGLSESTVRQYKARQTSHRKLLGDGSILVRADGTAHLTRDVVFSSPSAAGAVVQGTASINGREAWVTEDGVTFGAWEDRDVQ